MNYKLYTDGGCRGNGISSAAESGLGCYIENDQDDIRIKYNEKLFFHPNTNNKAEICAVIRGLQIMKNLGNSSFVKHKLTIFVDSAYVLNGITNWVNNWKNNNWRTSKNEEVKNKQLWITLDYFVSLANQNFDIEFKKVKGHNGILGNEIVDTLANQAMNGIEVYLNIDKETLKELKEEINE